jgi:hypothetical protein
MKTIKIMIVLFTTSLFSVANAGEISWTGSAEVTYNISSSDSTAGKSDNGKGMGISNDLFWSGTGELDNGYTWKVGGDLDSGTVDDTYFTMSLGGMGDLGFYNDDGSINIKHGSDQSVYGAGSDNGQGGGIVDPYDTSGYSNIRYTLPADLLPYGIGASVSKYVGGASATVDAGDAGSENDVDVKDILSYKVTATPVDGLDIGLGYYEEDAENVATDIGQEKKSGTINVTYAYGPATIGIGQSRIAPAIAAGTAITRYKNNNYSVAYAVNDQLSVSYAMEQSTRGKTETLDNNVIEVQSLQAAYTVGGATLSLTMDDIENAAYVKSADIKETMFSMARID